MQFTKNIFCENSASQGGVIFLNDSLRINLKNNSFIKNQANKGAVIAFT